MLSIPFWKCIRKKQLVRSPLPGRLVKENGLIWCLRHQVKPGTIIGLLLPLSIFNRGSAWIIPVRRLLIVALTLTSVLRRLLKMLPSSCVQPFSTWASRRSWNRWCFTVLWCFRVLLSAGVCPICTPGMTFAGAASGPSALWGLWPLSATLLTPRWSCSSTFSRARSKCRCLVRCWWSRRRTGWSSWSSWSGLISAGISAHLPVPVRCWSLRISEVVAKEELCPAFLGALGGPAKIQHSCPAIDLFAVILDVIRKNFSIECWANPAIHVSGILLTTLLANNGLLAVTNADQDHGVAVGVLIALLGFDVLSRLCWWDNIESDSV